MRGEARVQPAQAMGSIGAWKTPFLSSHNRILSNAFPYCHIHNLSIIHLALPRIVTFHQR